MTNNQVMRHRVVAADRGELRINGGLSGQRPIAPSRMHQHQLLADTPRDLQQDQASGRSVGQRALIFFPQGGRLMYKMNIRLY
mmetsp:Transcript_37712/g.58670  ORF Transcript_37712/g.58670 Transcript_37712/m.58670 type:complete len:83 (-) Transcript_37712:67-315(-)